MIFIFLHLLVSLGLLAGFLDFQIFADELFSDSEK